MSYLDVITEIHTELVRTKRSHGQSTSGPARTIPVLTAGDMLVLAVILAPGVTSAIQRLSGVDSLVAHQFDSFHVFNEKFIGKGYFNKGDFDYQLATSFELGDEIVKGPIGLPARQYLAGWAVDGDGARRSITNPALGPPRVVYAVARKPHVEEDRISFLRSTIRTWERMMVAMRSAIVTYGIGPDIGKDSCTEFLAATYSLASSLDVLQENPPTSLAADTKAAMRAAASATKEALADAARLGGEVAAGAANTLGEMIGEAAAGLGEGLGVKGLAVAGFVMYIVAKRYGWL